jgi:two-component sensor histidine kinase
MDGAFASGRLLPDGGRALAGLTAWKADLDGSDRPLDLMARTMKEGFALLRLDPTPNARPRVLYVNPALAQAIGGQDDAAMAAFATVGRMDLTALCRKALDLGRAARVEMGDTRHDRWWRLRLEPVRPGGCDLTLLVTDRTEEHRSARRHSEAFAELHHRVKNSLANAAGLLKLQGLSSEDPVLTSELRQAADRIRAIADLHDALYRFGEQDTVDLGLYLREVCDRLAKSMLQDHRIQLVVQTDTVRAPFERATPLGLILNELVTNAVKHAFPGAGEGEPLTGVIRVELRLDPDAIVLRVADDGRGLNGAAERPGGLGMRLVRSLAKQLKGELKVEPLPKGTAFELRMPPPLDRAGRGPEAGMRLL